jgi:hypothetical protein
MSISTKSTKQQRGLVFLSATIIGYYKGKSAQKKTEAAKEETFIAYLGI